MLGRKLACPIASIAFDNDAVRESSRDLVIRMVVFLLLTRLFFAAAFAHVVTLPGTYRYYV
jgi:hypothetical protein